jgi:hypothetical protein
MTEPPGPMEEEEFNAWYDDEQLPKRLALPPPRCGWFMRFYRAYGA